MPNFFQERIDRVRNLVRQVLNGPNAMRMRIQAITLQLERMEDKLSRIEDGLEAAGVLSKESRLKQRNLDPSKLGLEDTFDYIYLHRIWTRGFTTLSGTGSIGPWAEKFVELVKAIVKKHGLHTITDIGCGDFSIGSQICPVVDRYNALDVSGEIIRVNTERFSELTQVTFRRANPCVDLLPVADLAIIRQVMQHLSNVQVEAILQNIARTGFKYLLIAEHQPADDKLVKPNLDLETQSSGTRLGFGSGIYPDQPPFSRAVQRIAQFDGDGGQLAVYLWDFTKNPQVSVAAA